MNFLNFFKQLNCLEFRSKHFHMLRQLKRNLEGPVLAKCWERKWRMTCHKVRGIGYHTYDVYEESGTLTA